MPPPKQCSLSGNLFVITIDPLLLTFDWFIQENSLGVVRACADDVGAVLAELKNLGDLFDFFEAYIPLSGITLKPKK